MQDEIVSLSLELVGPSRSSQENPRVSLRSAIRFSAGDADPATEPQRRVHARRRNLTQAKGKSSAESRDRPGQIQPIQILFIRNAVSFFFLPFCSVDLNKFSLPFKKKKENSFSSGPVWLGHVRRNPVRPACAW